MRTRKCYFICFTVRSGSSLLCQLLADTGLAGAPKEHFYHHIGPDKPRGDAITDYSAYIKRALAADTTKNGIFGSKVGGGYWHDFTRRLRSISNLADLPLPDALDRNFPDLRYIHLTRRNKVRQAVSHWLAIESGRWSSLDPPSAETPAYNFDAIDGLLQEIIFREAVWAEYFASHGICPLVVVYEDFTQQPAATVTRILDYLDIELPSGFEVPASRHQPVGGELAERWTQRFREEKQTLFWRSFW